MSAHLKTFLASFLVLVLAGALAPDQAFVSNVFVRSMDSRLDITLYGSPNDSLCHSSRRTFRPLFPMTRIERSRLFCYSVIKVLFRSTSELAYVTSARFTCQALF